MHCPQYGRSSVGFVQVPPALVEPGQAIGNSTSFCVGLVQLSGEAPRCFRTRACGLCAVPVVATNLRKLSDRPCHMLVPLRGSGTFLKFSTLKMLSMSPTMSSLYNFFLIFSLNS